ncbi:MAG: nitroreductase family protein [Vulcanimicrobiaceae bacterium]
MDLLEALRTRRSIGKLAGDVSRDEIRALVEAALWAPNHRLTEPWRFSVLRGAARERLGRAWAVLLAQETPFEGERRATLLEREAAKPLRAPVVIAVSVRTDADPVVAAEDFAATAAAAQNLLLAAHAGGLGAIWRTGEMAYRREIREHLGLEPDDRIVAFIYLGRPGIEPPEARPRALEGVLRFSE